MKRILLFIALIITTLVISGCSDRNADFGYVDMQRVATESTKLKELNDQIEKKVTEFQALDTEEQKTLNAEDFAKNMQMRRSELMTLQKDLESQFMTTLTTAMEEVCKEKKLSAVLAKGSVLHGGVDVTDDVLKRIN